MTSSFNPNWASAPGDTIIDVLNDRGWSMADFAGHLEQPESRAQDLIEGRIAITIRTASKLAAVLGATAEFWMARDARYRETVGRLQQEARGWLSELPLSDMARFGWLEPAPRPTEEVDACLRFFGVGTIAKWKQTYGALQEQVAFRTSPTFDSRPGSVIAWLRRGEIEAARITCRAWNKNQFGAALAEVRKLTTAKNPSQFLPALQTICSEAGVAVAVVRAPAGCRASGATKFVSADKALLLLSFRYLSDDQFWFTFFHEAAHLLLHPIDRLFLEGMGDSSGDQETEANAFAENVLIPAEFRDELFATRRETRSILRFAKKIGIAPGIVVGQLQHHGRVPRNHFNGLKRRFEWK